MNAAVHLQRVQGHDPAALSDDDIRHRDMRMQLRITGHFHGDDLGFRAAVRCLAGDFEGGAGGIVVKGDPPDAALLGAFLAPLPFRAWPMTCSISAMVAATASLCAWASWLRSASVGAKAHANEIVLSAEKVKST